MKKYLSIAAVLLLASCAGDKTTEQAFQCPQAGIISQAGSLPIFEGNPKAPQVDDIKVLGSIDNFRGACRPAENGVVHFKLEVDFKVMKTDLAGELKSIRLPYFVAVLGPDESILQKQSLWTKIDFDKKAQGVSLAEIDLDIPVGDASQTGRYKVAIGFELTPQQAAYNVGDYKGK